MQPYVSREVADKVVSIESDDDRRRGAVIVAMQLHYSTVFASLFWWLVIIGVGATIWLHSWWPVAVVVALLALIYIVLFPLTSYRISRYGVLPEYQAAYKRLYYSDPGFKAQVDAVLRHTSD